MMFGGLTHIVLNNTIKTQYNLFLLTFFMSVINKHAQVTSYISEKKQRLLEKYPLLNNIYTKYKIIQNNYLHGNVSLVKDGNIVISVPRKDMSIYNIYPYDFCISTEYSSENDVLYRKIHFDNVDNYEYVPCTYKFISIMISLSNDEFEKNKRLELTLSDGSGTFFVEKNRINRYVIAYLLREQHNIVINPDEITYTIEIMDCNVKIISCCEVDEIFMETYSYIILQGKIPPKKPDCKCNDNDIEINTGKISDNISFNLDGNSINIGKNMEDDASITGEAIQMLNITQSVVVIDAVNIDDASIDDVTNVIDDDVSKVSVVEADVSDVEADVSDVEADVSGDDVDEVSIDDGDVSVVTVTDVSVGDSIVK